MCKGTKKSYTTKIYGHIFVPITYHKDFLKIFGRKVAQNKKKR